MKKKMLAVVLTVSLFAVMALALCACGEKVEMVGTYYLPSYTRYYTTKEGTDYWVIATGAVNLYSDGTYVLNEVVSEPYHKAANGWSETSDVNVINPLANHAITRCGTYEIEIDADLGTFALKLSKAERLIYATNAGGGHYPLVPTEATGPYVDGNDEKSAQFETEWFGNWEHINSLYGAAITLNGDSSTHFCDKGSFLYDYDTCMFYTLGLEIRK